MLKTRKNLPKTSQIPQNFLGGTCPQTYLAWHRPFGPRSFVSTSQKKFLGGPER